MKKFRFAAIAKGESFGIIAEADNTSEALDMYFAWLASSSIDFNDIKELLISELSE